MNMTASNKGFELHSAIFELIFQKSMDGLLLINSESGKILAVNEAVEKLLNMSAGQIVGSHFSELFPDSTQGQEEALERIKAYGSVIVTEYPTSTGCAQTMDVTATMIPWKKNDQLILAPLRDAGERIAAEKEREKLISDLQEELGKIKTLRGLLPICSHCNKIRNDP